MSELAAKPHEALEAAEDITCGDIFHIIEEVSAGNAAAHTSLALRETLILMGYDEQWAQEMSQQGDFHKQYLVNVALAPVDIDSRVTVLSGFSEMLDNMPEVAETGRSIILRELKEMGRIFFKNSVFNVGSSDDCAKLYDLQVECRRHIPRAGFDKLAPKLLAKIGMLDAVELYTCYETADATGRYFENL